MNISMVKRWLKHLVLRMGERDRKHQRQRIGNVPGYASKACACVSVYDDFGHEELQSARSSIAGHTNGYISHESDPQQSDQSHKCVERNLTTVLR